jgi:hypothetical protein
MFKIIGLIIPFLLEMVFGKKQEPLPTEDKDSLKPSNRKRFIVSIIMLISFSINYLAIGRLYSLSLSYIALNNEKNIYKVKNEVLENNKARAEQLEKSLQYCMDAAITIKKKKSC